jgi:hypothetical protein
MLVGSEVFDVVVDCDVVRFCSIQCLNAAGQGSNMEVICTEVEVEDLDENGELLKEHRKQCDADVAYLEQEYSRSR